MLTLRNCWRKWSGDDLEILNVGILFDIPLNIMYFVRTSKLILPYSSTWSVYDYWDLFFIFGLRILFNDGVGVQLTRVIGGGWNIIDFS